MYTAHSVSPLKHVGDVSRLILQTQDRSHPQKQLRPGGAFCSSRPGESEGEKPISLTRRPQHPVQSVPPSKAASVARSTKRATVSSSKQLIYGRQRLEEDGFSEGGMSASQKFVPPKVSPQRLDNCLRASVI
eukprot:1069053-Prorocentrum_minimum.AAC.4